MSSSWTRLLGSAVRGIENRIDELRGREHRRPRHIVAYHGFGTRQEIRLSGRVLADEPLWASDPEDSWWRNLRATWRRMGSAEVPGVVVEVELGGGRARAVTDEEGYFRARVRPAEPLPPDTLWHHGEARSAGDPPVRTPLRALTPPATAAFGVVSDLDDTVVRTDVANRFRMFRELLLGNAHTRSPFHGVAAFYRALHRGVGGTGPNPLFYVSSSPWNLYDLLLDFLQHRDIPVGPLFLRDWGVSEHELVPGSHGFHKHGYIRQLLDTYPTLPFILIGDSGQKDPEIYCRIARDYPGRIPAIYIRDVSLTTARQEQVRALADTVQPAGSTLVLSADTLTTAHHAARHGWIGLADLEVIEEEERSGR